MKTAASTTMPQLAMARVLKIQANLHRWATQDRRHRFTDLFNLVCDSAFLSVAWHRVRCNTGSRSVGIDRQTARDITGGRGEAAFLADLRAELKARTFRPLPVRE